jgi:hypothetical protein
MFVEKSVNLIFYKYIRTDLKFNTKIIISMIKFLKRNIEIFNYNIFFLLNFLFKKEEK